MGMNMLQDLFMTLTNNNPLRTDKDKQNKGFTHLYLHTYNHNSLP